MADLLTFSDSDMVTLYEQEGTVVKNVPVQPPKDPDMINIVYGHEDFLVILPPTFIDLIASVQCRLGLLGSERKLSKDLVLKMLRSSRFPCVSEENYHLVRPNDTIYVCERNATSAQVCQLKGVVDLKICYADGQQDASYVLVDSLTIAAVKDLAVRSLSGAHERDYRILVLRHGIKSVLLKNMVLSQISIGCSPLTLYCEKAVIVDPVFPPQGQAQSVIPKWNIIPAHWSCH